MILCILLRQNVSCMDEIRLFLCAKLMGTRKHTFFSPASATYPLCRGVCVWIKPGLLQVSPTWFPLHDPQRNDGFEIIKPQTINEFNNPYVSACEKWCFHRRWREPCLISLNDLQWWLARWIIGDSSFSQIHGFNSNVWSIPVFVNPVDFKCSWLNLYSSPCLMERSTCFTLFDN